MAFRILTRLIFSIFIVLGILPLQAQDGLNLPADLYVLLNDGRVERYGVGASGVETVTPTDAFVTDFGVDATGRRIAYRTESGLYLLDVSLPGTTPIQVEGTTANVPPFRGSGDTIAWSPTGDGIAYTTTYGARVYFSTGGDPIFLDLSEGAFKQVSWSPGGRFLAAESDADGTGIWWIYRRDGFTLTLTSIITDGIGVVWISDGEVVFSPVGGGLRLMSLDRANQQITLLDESNVYRLPALDSTDALVFFARDPNDPNIPDGYGQLLRLERGAQQVQVIGEIPVALSNLEWSPDGSLLVAFQGGVLAFFNPSNGLGFPLPINGAVAYDWGPVTFMNPTAALEVTINPTTEGETALLPTEAPTLAPLATNQPTPIPIVTANALVLSANGFFLAPGADGIVQVWRLPADGSPPAPFTRNTSDTIEFTPSPDGESVAYVVDAELWYQTRNETPFRLARLNSFAPATPVFSPDGEYVAYADEGAGIWRIAIENARGGEDPELLRARTIGETPETGQALRRPQFSPDGTKLLFDVYVGDTVANSALDVNTRESAEGVPLPASDLRPSRATWLRDGRIYTVVDASAPVSDAPPGIYMITPPDLSTGTMIAPLPSGAVVREAIEPIPGMLRLLIADSTNADASLSVVDVTLSDGVQETVLEIGALTAPRLSEDGRFVGGLESLTPVGGTLTIIDLVTGRRFLISSATEARSFLWARA